MSEIGFMPLPNAGAKIESGTLTGYGSTFTFSFVPSLLIVFEAGGYMDIVNCHTKHGTNFATSGTPLISSSTVSMDGKNLTVPLSMDNSAYIAIG